MTDNLLIRKFKNTDGNDNSTNTLDYWIYDLNYSNTNPVTIFIDIPNKYDESYVRNLYKKECKPIKSKVQVIEPIKTPLKASTAIKSTVKALDSEFSKFFG